MGANAAVDARARKKGGSRVPASFNQLHALVNMAMGEAHAKGTKSAMASAARAWISFLNASTFAGEFIVESPELADKGRPFFIPVLLLVQLRCKKWRYASSQCIWCTPDL